MKKRNSKLAKNKFDVVDSNYKNKIASPTEQIWIKAIKNKTWIVSNNNNETKTDFGMYDLVLSGATGFSPKTGMTHLDVLRAYYIALFPFCERLVSQYLYAYEEVECQREEITTLLQRNAARITKIKLMEKFLKDRGMMKEYEEQLLSQTPEEIGK